MRPFQKLDELTQQLWERAEPLTNNAARRIEQLEEQLDYLLSHVVVNDLGVALPTGCSNITPQDKQKSIQFIKMKLDNS